MKVRAISCSSCGGPKVTPSTSAYLYCDYCGRYLDWDFYRAVASKTDRLPGPEYERLAAEQAPKTEAAKRRGDQGEYCRLQRALFEVHMQGCPASYSPRIGDPAYREAMLDYTSKYYTLLAFDDEIEAANAVLTQATAALEWLERKPGAVIELPAALDDYRELIAAASAAVQCESGSFWRFFQAFEAHNRLCTAKAQASGLLETYPDEVDAEKIGRTSFSIFTEAWMPYLSGRDQARLLEQTGLAAEYREVDDRGLQQRHCGKCGATRQIPEAGAHTVVCESCGHKLDVGSAELACGGCGGPVSVPRGFESFPCPYCRAEIRTVSLTVP